MEVYDKIQINTDKSYALVTEKKTSYNVVQNK